MTKKYPRTPHLPFSDEVHSDDKALKNTDQFIGVEIVMSEKLDGGNSKMNMTNIYPRSREYATHETFDYMKAVHYYSKKHLFKEGYDYFGENMFGIHSIEYNALTDFFYLFGIKDKKNFISYMDTVKEAYRLEYKMTPLLFAGRVSSEKELELLIRGFIKKGSRLGGDMEGVVVRIADAFPADEFGENVAKFVRKGHVQTDKHWKDNWEKAEIMKSADA